MEDFLKQPHQDFLKQVRTWDKIQCVDFLVHSSIIDDILAKDNNPKRVLLSMDVTKLKSLIVSHAQNNPNEYL